MPDYSSQYEKRFKVESLKGVGPLDLTIKEARLEELDGILKIVVSFEEDHREVVCNKTRYEQIAEVAGSTDTDEWPGTRVRLGIDPNVMFGGKRVGGLAFSPAPDEDES